MAEDIKQRIQGDVKEAMRSQSKDRLGTLRMLTAAIKQREVDERITLDDTAVISVVEKMIKQRRESIKQFQEANRPELAEKEAQEIQILEDYMPQALSQAEVDAAIEKAIQTTGASTMKDMGKVMGLLKGELQGRADMAAVSAAIKARLA